MVDEAVNNRMCDVVIDSSCKTCQYLPTQYRKTALHNNQTGTEHACTIPTPTYFFSQRPINFFSTRKIRSPPNRSGEYSS